VAGGGCEGGGICRRGGGLRCPWGEEAPSSVGIDISLDGGGGGLRGCPCAAAACALSLARLTEPALGRSIFHPSCDWLIACPYC
jgi:hypothetical protein